MADRYLRLTGTGPGRFVTRRLGLPQPARLRRWSADAPGLDGPVLRLAAGESAPPAAPGDRPPAAVVLDATGIADPSGLGAVRDSLQPLVRSLATCGRVVVLGAVPDRADVHRCAAQQALEGFVRSLGKEIGRGRTVQLVRLAPGAAAGSTLDFLLSPKSAYVSGQVIEVGPARGGPPPAPRAGAGTGAAPGAEAAAGPEPGPGAGLDPEAGAAAGPEPERKTGAEPKSKAGAGPEPGLGAGAEPEVGAAAGPGSEPMSEAEAGAGAESGSKTGSEAGGDGVGAGSAAAPAVSPPSAPDAGGADGAAQAGAGGGPAARRTALVTGSARGIGAAVAETLARDGAHVVCLDVPQAGEALAATAARIGGTALALDITAPDAAERIAAAVPGGLDILVHNAGITRDRKLANMAADRWEPVIEVNLGSVLRVTDHLLKAGAIRPDGRIVATASIAGIAGNAGQTNYAASKAGVIGFVRALAEAPDVRERGITVNAVAPGFIETRMTAAVPLFIREAGRRMNSMGQGGQPQDVAETVAWFAARGSGGVTGQVVRVCGQSLLGA